MLIYRVNMCFTKKAHTKNAEYIDEHAHCIIEGRVLIYLHIANISHP